ncbi:solute carrier family 23 member 2-like [Amphiura filiformis]|uniref:solute carrier family 23 member 2-like n=1 Tax=Amphiura filiformis TaxID=82378 RepID=UPI003B20D876
MDTQDNSIQIINSNEEANHENADGIMQNVTKKKTVIFDVDERPPWYLAISLGFQHSLTFFGSGITPPLVLAGPLCMDQDPLAVSQLISTAFFIEGIITLLQVTFGVRVNTSDFNFSQFNPRRNGQLYRGVAHKDTYRSLLSIPQIQGAIIGASFLQILIGFTGIIGFLLKFIGPMTVAPVIALVGIGAVDPASTRAGQHWGIAALTIILILLFSQFLSKVEIPIPGWKHGKCSIAGKVPIFKMFPIVLGVLLTWLIAFIFTTTGVFPEDPSSYGYEARTDLKSDVIEEASWFRIPYPGQWGLPIITLAGVLGMFSAVIASVIESLGDYYATARMAGAPPPPPHAVNRGIGVEGIGCILAGLWGTANGTTTFSQNAGLVGLTRVGSRVVIQICAITMIIVGMLGKVTALFSSIPLPIVGGMLCILFGMVLAVGLSNLQYVDLNSPRNMLILGFSLFMGMLIPYWAGNNRELIETGILELDQIIVVLLTTGMFIGGLFAFIMDNIIPGTIEERGLVAFSRQYKEDDDEINSLDVYDLPFGMTLLRQWKWTQYIPFSPTYKWKEKMINKKEDHSNMGYLETNENGV